jgi:hypothetical protein
MWLPPDKKAEEIAKHQASYYHEVRKKKKKKRIKWQEREKKS